MCEAVERIYAQAKAKDRIEGRTEEVKEIARRMFQKGLTVSEIADISNRSEIQTEVWLRQVAA